MEKELLACALASREDYALILNYINTKSASYSKEFQVLMARVGEYYDRDKDATQASVSVLKALISETIRSEKLVSRLSDFLDEAISVSASVPNVRGVVLAAKRQEAADKLSVLLASGEHDKASTALAEYQELLAKGSLDDPEEEDILHCVDVATLVTSEYDPTNVISIYPSSLNDRLDGGAKKGHHVTVFGRPNKGKSAFCINLGSGVAYQGKRIMHLINEDRAEDIYLRYVSNLSGKTKQQIKEAPEEAQRIAKERGLDNVIVKNIKPGTPDQIKELINKYNPEVVIVDQLRNLQVKADSRTNQLEAAATAMRNIGKECNVLMVSVTQAGDSGRDKLILDDGDIDFSNTGIPAQADLLIGIGVDPDHEARDLRVLSIIKNKIGGIEDHFPVRINRLLSRYGNV